jgi:delta-aminolevulinic acid dehydratase/porphobilinogen synthase
LVKNLFNKVVRVCVQVSGEYAMLYYGAKHGAFELKKAVLETFKCMRRAGKAYSFLFLTLLAFYMSLRE